MADPAACTGCGKRVPTVGPVRSIHVYAPKLHRPYPLITHEDDLFHVCSNERCRGVWVLIDKAQEGHPVVREAGPWTRAIVILDNGAGRDVLSKDRPASAAPASC